MSTTSHPLHLGCPVWNCSDWVGSVYSTAVPKNALLTEYSAALSAVELNSTFYAMPSQETLQRWSEQVGDGFGFCPKFARTISHERHLEDTDDLVAGYLREIAVLHRSGCLGPVMLQLPPGFSPRELGRLERFLEGVPEEFDVAVEVRHEAFFEGSGEAELNAMLAEYGADRVLFDTRPLHSAPPEDDYEVASQGRKPKLPVAPFVTGRQPVVRLVGRNRLEATLPYLQQWAKTVGKWLVAGYRPWFFCHTPNEKYAPEMARAFYQLLRQEMPTLPEPPVWPGELEKQRKSQQRNLF